MKRFKLLTVILAIAITGVSIFVSKNAQANVAPEAGHKKFVGCNIVDQGGVVQYGNTCDAGSKVCLSNPCGN